MLKDKKIIQIIPLHDAKADSEHGWDYQDKKGLCWFVIGAALADDGNVYPLAWDRFLRFQILDPTLIEAVQSLELGMRSRSRLEELNYFSDNYDWESWKHANQAND